MARPKNANPEETRRKILDAAVAELEAVGALELSTRAVARRAGVAVATVHSHFVDRQGLIDAIINRVYGKLAEGAFALREEVRGADARETIERAVRAGFRFSREYQHECRALLLQVTAEGGLDSSRQRETQLPYLASVASALAPTLGLPVDTVRLRLQSINFTVARWGISADDELKKLVGSDDIDECVRRVEDHLVEIALLQLITNP